MSLPFLVFTLSLSLSLSPAFSLFLAPPFLLFPAYAFPTEQQKLRTISYEKDGTSPCATLFKEVISRHFVRIFTLRQIGKKPCPSPDLSNKTYAREENTRKVTHTWDQTALVEKLRGARAFRSFKMPFHSYD